MCFQLVFGVLQYFKRPLLLRVNRPTSSIAVRTLRSDAKENGSRQRPSLARCGRPGNTHAVNPKMCHVYVSGKVYYKLFVVVFFAYRKLLRVFPLQNSADGARH